MGHLAKLVVFCVLFAFGSAHASIPGTAATEFSASSSGPWTTDKEAACDQFGPTYYSDPGRWNQCLSTAGSFYSRLLNTRAGLSCPVNSTKDGTACTCNSGFVQDPTNTSCIALPDPAIAACAAVSGSEAGSINSPYIYGTDMQATDATICESYLGIYNCAVSVNYLMAVEYQGQWTKTGVGRFTGSVCTPGAGSPAPLASTGDPVNAPTVNPCAEGSVLGTVNGVSTCSPPSDLNVVQAVKTTTASAPAGSASAPTSGLGADAPPTAVKMDEQTSCTGGNCTTEKKYSDATGAVVGTVVSTDTQAAFCANNPDALICGGDSGSMADFCKKNPTALACVSPNLGELTDQPLDNSSVALAITPDTGWGAGAGSCPAPRTVQLSTISVSMPFDLLCDFAVGIRPVVIALAWLAAALGFIGFARRD